MIFFLAMMHGNLINSFGRSRFSPNRLFSKRKIGTLGSTEVIPIFTPIRPVLAAIPKTGFNYTKPNRAPRKNVSFVLAKRLNLWRK